MFRIPETLLAVGIVLATSVQPLQSATFNFTLDGQSGTFEAPEGGGAITALTVTIGATVFDALDAGAFAPVYNPILNTLNGLMDVEFRGAVATTAAIYNSVASAECPGGAGQCVLQLFDTVGGTLPPEFLAVNLDTFDNLDFGYYSIDPDPVDSGVVPLPAAGWLMLAALGGLGAAGAARRRR